jgi:hypothetical protein
MEDCPVDGRGIESPDCLSINVMNSRNFAAVVCLIAIACVPTLTSGGELTVRGTRFEHDGKPFTWTGVSFFNAIYNPAFNESTDARKGWLEKFRRHGINVLRIWCQWDNTRGFVDASPTSTMYERNGALRGGPLARLKEILGDAEALDMCVELTLFSHESYREEIRIGEPADEAAVRALARELISFRNVAFQIWNEHSDSRVLPLIKSIRTIDPKRLVTNSPGFSGVLGSDEENETLDFLTPHTTRQGKERHWEVGPRQIADLLAKYKKPVVDDEPARNGTPKFGGPPGATSPFDHIVQILRVWDAGGYQVYHHDMFQTGYGSPACPPSGIPDPEFSPYHRQVFEFLARREQYNARN